MVARINSGKSIKGALNYNEKKVAQERASLLMVENYPLDKELLDYDQKLLVLQQYARLNERVVTNCVHISLNFETNEQVQPAKLQQIVQDYIAQIGFGEQPYLVYQHTDAAHPHVHIVTTNIQLGGERISLHNLGREKSEPAREAIELKYGLIRARGRGADQQVRQELEQLRPGAVTRVAYGKAETKKAITQIVTLALQKYNVTSLPELNAVLNQFGVTADRGNERSNTYKHGGLLYRMIDEQGRHVGVPIKSSKIYNSPTLKKLESRFEKNNQRRPQLKNKLKFQIDRVFKRYEQVTRATLIKELGKLDIQLLFRENKDGVIYGLTYIDHRNRSVFNGSDLGKACSAKAILERLAVVDQKIVTEQGLTGNSSGRVVAPSHFLRIPAPNPLLKALVGKNDPNLAPTVSRKKKKRKGEQEQSMNL
ncbi:relaxase/mobilization nuclease domain-containing protein [Mucilaginibacter sp.]|uniref:relaxase/mobilization nuclease domain-containing protein n=1 Tax=Mucilaginibacter sp. TaxID=1882438 RepID=UPI003264B728